MNRLLAWLLGDTAGAASSEARFALIGLAFSAVAYQDGFRREGLTGAVVVVVAFLLARAWVKARPAPAGRGSSTP